MLSDMRQALKGTILHRAKSKSVGNRLRSEGFHFAQNLNGGLMCPSACAREYKAARR